MRLWGIALEPFWPTLNGSWTSPISVCCRLRISVAIRSRLPPRIAIAVEQGRVAVTLDDLRAGRVGVQSERGEHLRLDVGVEVAVRPDRARDLAGADLVDRRGEPVRPRSISNAQPATLRPNVIGSAWTECVRPIIVVSASARARATRTSMRRSVSSSRRVPGRAELEREAGIDDIAARQAEMEVSPLRTRPTRRPG